MEIKLKALFQRKVKKTGNKFIVVERQKRSLTTSPVDISIIDSVNDRTYPGALQLADKAFVENRPTILMVKESLLTLI